MDLLNMESLEKYNMNNNYYTAGYKYYSDFNASQLSRANVVIKPKSSVSTPSTTVNVPQQSQPNTSFGMGNVNPPQSSASISVGNVNTPNNNTTQSTETIGELMQGNLNPNGASIPKVNASTPAPAPATNGNPSSNTNELPTESNNMGFPMGGGGGGGGGGMPTEEQSTEGATQEEVSKTVKKSMSKNTKIALGLLTIVGIYLIYKNKTKLFSK